MTNTETMQLDLFNGLVLTTEQQEEINNFINKQAKRAVDSQDNVNRTMLLMDEAGFVQGKDYISNFEVHEVTKEVSFGYSYNSTNYEHEVTYMNAVGGVYLKVNIIKDNKIKTHNASVNREYGKIMCTSVTEQYRYYKPSSLYTKFNEYNERKVNELARTNKESIAMDNVITKFRKQYPEATVYASTDYYRRSYQSFPIVKVKFASGSEVSFTLGYGDDLENVRFHKKYDAVSESTEALMERFNNQKAK